MSASTLAALLAVVVCSIITVGMKLARGGGARAGDDRRVLQLDTDKHRMKALLAQGVGGKPGGTC